MKILDKSSRAVFELSLGWWHLAFSTWILYGLPRPDDDPHWELPYGDPVFMAWGQKKENDG